MYRKYYLVEVVILLLLSHGGWNGPSVTLLSCTSESSKLVRDVVQKRFLPVVERYRVSLPLECPLHPRRDMFWWLQTELEATKSAGEETWNCPVCGKKFRCENTFVTHWDASHSRSMGITDETVCLDDFCDVFRCDILRKNMQKQRREEEEELQKAMADRSFQLTTFSFRYKPELSEEEEEEIRRNKRRCDRKVMSHLHKKCRSLVRQCTIGMLANLSSKDFQDIEDDLDQAICSFLTCDRYWDDFDAGIHHVPALVLAIFGLIIISLFSFCYYGTWVLMEKSPIGANQLCCNCQKSQSVEYRPHRARAHRYKYRQISPDLRKNSPDFRRNTPDFRQNSPDFRKNSPESRERILDFRQNSLENRERILDLRQNSPDNREHILDLRQNSPDNRERVLDLRQNSPDRRGRVLDLRQNSPDFRHNSPDYRHNSPDFRHNSPDFRHNSPDPRETSPEYRQNSPEYRHNSPDYRDNSPEYRANSPDYRDNSPESRQNSPDYRDNSPDFAGNQPDFRYNSPDFRLNSPNFRHNSPNFRQNSPDCQQNSPDFIATKRAPSRCAR